VHRVAQDRTDFHRLPGSDEVQPRLQSVIKLLIPHTVLASWRLGIGSLGVADLNQPRALNSLEQGCCEPYPCASRVIAIRDV